MKQTLLVFVILMTATAVHAQDAALFQYVGKYKFPDGNGVPGMEVTIDNGVLHINSAAGSSNLQLLGKDSFNIVNFNGYAVFRRQEGTQKIVAVHIEASGYVLEGPRDSGSVSLQGRKQAPAICFPERIYSSRREAEQAMAERR